MNVLQSNIDYLSSKISNNDKIPYENTYNYDQDINPKGIYEYFQDYITLINNRLLQSMLWVK